MLLETVYQTNGLAEVRMTKDILSESVPAFRDEMYALASKPGLRVVLNFGNVEHMCSRALGVLAVAAGRLQKSGGALGATGLSANLVLIFKYARLDRSIPMVEFSYRAAENAAVLAA